MTQKAVNIADIPDEDGKTPRQKNREKVHNIPVGSFVESKEFGFRLYVAKHVRDCDETPLYALSTDPEAGERMDMFEEKMEEYRRNGDERNYEITRSVFFMKKGALDGNYPEEDLEVIHEP